MQIASPCKQLMFMHFSGHEQPQVKYGIRNPCVRDFSREMCVQLKLPIHIIAQWFLGSEGASLHTDGLESHIRLKGCRYLYPHDRQNCLPSRDTCPVFHAPAPYLLLSYSCHLFNKERKWMGMGVERSCSIEINYIIRSIVSNLLMIVAPGGRRHWVSYHCWYAMEKKLKGCPSLNSVFKRSSNRFIFKELVG